MFDLLFPYSIHQMKIIIIGRSIGFIPPHYGNGCAFFRVIAIGQHELHSLLAAGKRIVDDAGMVQLTSLLICILLIFARHTNNFIGVVLWGNKHIINLGVYDCTAKLGQIEVCMQRANKDALEKLAPNQVYHTFPDRREGSKSSLILKKPKTKKSNRVLYMTKPLKEELLAWLEKLKQDEQNAPEKYSNCGQLFRLPDGLPIAPELLTKWYRQWRSAHPEFEQIVFHGLRHSSATYQLLQSDGDFKSVQGNTGHATAAVLMDTYAHTQDKPRLELAEKIEANFYTQDLTPAAPQQPPESKQPEATKITGKEILEAIRLMDSEERRELTRVLFA